MNFQFYSPTRVLFGAGRLKELPEYLPHGKILLVTDETMEKLGFVSRVKHLLPGREIAVFSDVEPNPSDRSVDRAAALAAEFGASAVVGLGGGSPMDVAKGAACLVTNGGNLADYRRGGSRIFQRAGLPIYCIPTTAGTGSEVTFAGVFAFENGKVKTGIVTPFFYPALALVDPELTYSVPPRGTAATGLDALTHAMESYMGQVDTPQSDGMAMVAVQKVLQYLERAVKNGEDTQARQEMCIASLVASHASSQSEICLGHAAGYPVTTLYHLEHGFACALFLPETIRLAALHRPERMADLCRFCGLPDIQAFQHRIKSLLKQVGCPLTLKELGGTSAEIPELVAAAMGARYITNTPGGMTEEQLTEIFKNLMA